MPTALKTKFVTTADGSVLRAVRDTIMSADELLICVAFMSKSGVELLAEEFTEARKRNVTTRLLVTTTFGTTDASALDKAESLGLQTRIYNPGSGTFHPKLYLGQTRDSATAFIGSANMTWGLTGNVEAGIAFEGSANTDVMRSAWDWAAKLWDEPVVEYPALRRRVPVTEEFDATLYPLIVAETKKNPVFLTIPRGRLNEVTSISRTGLMVRTEASAPDSEEVPAWMFNIAWGHLRLHGELSNDKLLNDLRVHRSSSVRAVLARLSPVTVSKRGTLHWVSATH